MKTEKKTLEVKAVLKSVFSFCFVFLLLGSGLPCRAEVRIPPAPRPPRLVNDFAGVLGRDALGVERILRAFNDSTSNQITVVTVPDLGSYTASRFAYEIGEQWGVGNKKYNNGIVVLIKPKNEHGSGQAFIATGYGLEAALPDAVCKRIVEDEMIPFFKQDDYVGGLLNGLRVIMPLAAGEISAKEYMPSGGGIVAVVVAFVLILLVIGMVSAASRKGRGDRFGGPHDGDGLGSGLGTWWLLSSAMNGGNHGGSWGSFSNGSGAFGGFGGGSFGGGGAGGSW